MNHFFGTLDTNARSIMLIGLLTRLVTLVLGFFIVTTLPINIVRIVGDALIFTGALIYYFGEDANRDVKNIYGASLFVILASIAGIVLGLIQVDLPIYVTLGIDVAILAFELFAICDICLFTTNYLEDTLTKVLTIIVLILTVIAIFARFMWMFWTINQVAVDAIAVLNMIVVCSVIGCFVLTFANLIIFNVKE